MGRWSQSGRYVVMHRIDFGRCYVSVWMERWLLGLPVSPIGRDCLELAGWLGIQAHITRYLQAAAACDICCYLVYGQKIHYFVILPKLHLAMDWTFVLSIFFLLTLSQNKPTFIYTCIKIYIHRDSGICFFLYTIYNVCLLIRKLWRS